MIREVWGSQAAGRRAFGPGLVGKGYLPKETIPRRSLKQVFGVSLRSVMTCVKE